MIKSHAKKKVAGSAVRKTATKSKKEVIAKAFAKSIAESALGLKAVDVKIFDLHGLCSFTDFFIVCSGTSSRHVQSIANRIVEDQKKNGHKVFSLEGYERGDWVLIDYGDTVAHVFHPEARGFYNIERLWGDAKRVRV